MLRRQFIRSSAGIISALPFLNMKDLISSASTIITMNETFHISIGEIQCTIFRDMMYNYGAKDFFSNADPNELEVSLRRFNNATDEIASPFIAVLLQHADKKILIDTGTGYYEKSLEFRGKSSLIKGRLLALLQQEKINVLDVTDVVITHFHPDHIGGLFNEKGAINFPNAQIHIHHDEWTYWHSSKSGNQPALFHYFIEKNITPLKHHNVNLFRGDLVDLLPGITAIKAGGHTPGQIALMIHSRNEHLLYVSDAFLHPLHIERLDWRTNYDSDDVNARQSRINLLELAHKNNALISAFHFDFPGLGRVERSEKGWAWEYASR
jgi:glyoxylase-like metal-dependent hydrolase (beta-lactamase superfamily II)